MKIEAANTIVNGSVAPADDLKYSTVAVTSVDVCSTIAGIVVKYPAAAQRTAHHAGTAGNETTLWPPFYATSLRQTFSLDQTVDRGGSVDQSCYSVRSV